METFVEGNLDYHAETQGVLPERLESFGETYREQGHLTRDQLYEIAYESSTRSAFDLLPRLKTRESHYGISGRARPCGFKTHTFHASLAGLHHRRGCLVARSNTPHPQPSHRRSRVLWTDSLR